MTFSITQDRPPIAVVSEHCRWDGCEQIYVLPLNEPLSAQWSLMHFEGWTDHPNLGPVCPQHGYGTPVAELEAAQVDRPTAPFPAISDDLPYCAYCEMPIRQTMTGWVHCGESCGFTAKPIPAPFPAVQEADHD